MVIHKWSALLAGVVTFTAAQASALTWTDGRLRLTVNPVVGEVLCVDGGATVGINAQFDLSGSIASSGVLDRMVMIPKVDGVDAEPTVIAMMSDFVLVGRTYTATFDQAAIVPDGSHSVEVCFALATATSVSSIRGCLPAFGYNLVCQDANPPSIEASRSPEPNAAGWNNTDVTVTFSCSDAETGIASCSEPMVVSTEGVDQSVTGEAIDNAGNASQLTVSGIHIDKTAPSVTIHGLRSYTADEQVEIGCDIFDELSGVESSSCESVSAPAYSFAAGDYAVSASASDYAGNSASASGTFTVVVTADSLSNVVSSFIDSRFVGASMTVTLMFVDRALDMNKPRLAANLLKAFDMQVRAHSGRLLTAEEAATLLALSQDLLAH